MIEQINSLLEKYALDLLQETKLLGCKIETLSIKSHLRFLDIKTIVLKDSNHYRQLPGKLIYLIATPLNIFHTIRVISQFIEEPSEVYWATSLHVLSDIK